MAIADMKRLSRYINGITTLSLVWGAACYIISHNNFILPLCLMAWKNCMSVPIPFAMQSEMCHFKLSVSSVLFTFSSSQLDNGPNLNFPRGQLAYTGLRPCSSSISHSLPTKPHGIGLALYTCMGRIWTPHKLCRCVDVHSYLLFLTIKFFKRLWEHVDLSTYVVAQYHRDEL